MSETLSEPIEVLTFIALQLRELAQEAGIPEAAAHFDAGIGLVIAHMERGAEKRRNKRH